jgi:decaprenylphospho-beta-D-erythro-pentofuranosid-2-ulose 2-reductase
MKRATRVPQNVLLVGGTSEIGAALLSAWLDLGLERVTATARRSDDLERLSASCERAGVIVSCLELDVTDPAAIPPVVAEAWAHGDVDLVVIAVGLLGDQARIEADPSAARAVIEVNTVGTIHVALEAANRLEAQGHGTLVLLSSVAGQRGRRDNYVYGASKAALDAFAEGLAQRLEPAGVDVLLVRPGFVRSKMSAAVEPAPFAVTVEESRDAILSAISRSRSVVWVPGVLAPVFFALKLLPRRAWAAIVRRMR